MFNRNKEIKIARGNIPNWAIAEKLRISENTLLRRLRYEMSNEEKQRILNVIKELKSEVKKEANSK